MTDAKTHPTFKLDLAAIGGRLRELRQLRGWRLRDVAERCGVHVSVVGLVETGKRSTRLATMTAMVEALGTRLDYVVHGIGRPRRRNFHDGGGPAKAAPDSPATRDGHGVCDFLSPEAVAVVERVRTNNANGRQ